MLYMPEHYTSRSPTGLINSVSPTNGRVTRLASKATTLSW
jgi:hypothetical protein